MIKLTHANTNESVMVDKSLLFAIYYSQHAAATLVVSSGGAIVPVKESVEQVVQLKAGEEKPDGTR